MKYEFLFLSIFVFASCSMKKEHLKHHHTLKLQNAMSISFKSINEVDFKIDSAKYTNIRVKILAVNHRKEKTQLLLETVNTSGSLEFSPPDNLQLYTYLVATVESVDENGNNISSVDTYKIGDQDEINKAKKSLLNN